MHSQTEVVREAFLDTVRLFIEEQNDIETLRTAFSLFADSIDKNISPAHREMSMRRLLCLMYGHIKKMEAKMEAEIKGAAK